MALSFLYPAFIRILRLVRLSRRDRDKSAIEIVMFHHDGRRTSPSTRPTGPCDLLISLRSQG